MTIYRAHPKYRLYLLLSLLLVVLLGWSLLQTQDPGSLLFLVISLALGIWHGWAMLSKVELLPEAVVLHRPVGIVRKVEFRQLLEVTKEGRTGRAILLLYHPIEESGLLDLDQVSTLALPAVSEQAQLFDRLTQHVPV